MDEIDDDDYEPSSLMAYAVRIAGSRQVMGIFVAESLDQLWVLVDECDDPIGTEYLRLGAGGAYVAGLTKAQWPSRAVLDEDGQPMDILPEDAEPLNGAEMGDHWFVAMENGDWRPLESGRRPPKASKTNSRPAGRIPRLLLVQD